MSEFQMPMTIDTPAGELNLQAECEVYEPTGRVSITHLKWWGKWVKRDRLHILADADEWARCRGQAQQYYTDRREEIEADWHAADADYRYDLRAAE